MGIGEVLTAPRSPWQNPYAERVIGSLRRECLDHIVVFNEASLRHILKSYFEYYEHSRTHLVLEKDAPESRAIQPREARVVVQLPQMGGLHHRYERRPPESVHRSRLLAETQLKRINFRAVAPRNNCFKTFGASAREGCRDNKEPPRCLNGWRSQSVSSDRVFGNYNGGKLGSLAIKARPSRLPQSRSMVMPCALDVRPLTACWKTYLGNQCEGGRRCSQLVLTGPS